MKILVLGGAGDMGSQAVEDVAVAPDVTCVTIGDRDIPAAERLAARAEKGRAKVVARGVDANDHGALVRLMKEHDVVASAVGPFHRFEARMIEAAIEARVPYASICDEWQAAEGVIDGLNGRARERGCIAITGLGASPGISSVAAAWLARGFDRLRRIDISTFQPLDAGGGPAVLQHLLYIMSGDVVAHRDGERRLIPACSESRVEEFPRFGRVRVWNMGHSEPATLPRYFPDVREVNFLLGFGRGSELFVRPAQWGLFRSGRRIDAVAAVLHRLAALTKPEEPGTGALRVDVWGERDGAIGHSIACGVGQMRTATGLSLSIGTLMLGRRQLTTTQGGVYAPEGVIEPVGFIEEFRTRGLELFEDLAMARPVRTDGARGGAPVVSSNTASP